MPADLENDMNELGARLLAEAPPVTTDEVLRYTAERRSPTTTIDPLITNVPLTDITDITSVRRPRRRSVLVASVAAASVFAVGVGIASRDDREPDEVAIGATPSPTSLASAPLGTLATEVVADLAWPPRVVFDDGFGWMIEELIEDGQSLVETGTAFYRNPELGELVVNYLRSGDEWPVPMDDDSIEVATISMLGADVVVYGGTPESLEWPTGTDSDGSAMNQPSDAFVSFEATLKYDGHVISVASNGVDQDDFVAAVAGMHPVTEETFQAIVPYDHVLPADRARVVDAALSGVPLPDGFDAEPIRSSVAIRSLGGVNNEAGYAVVCAWVDVWSAAGGAVPDDVATALAGIREWPAFVTERGSGSVLFQITDAIGSGELIGPDGAVMTVETAGGWLECDGYEPMAVG